MTFEELMDYAISRNCSDVHITQGTNLAVRRYGELIILDSIPTFEEARDMIYKILTPEEIARVENGEDVDVGRMIDNEVRIRANVYHQRNNLACSIRLLMAQIPGAIQSAHHEGMHTLNDDLVRLHSQGLISRKTALDAAYDPLDLAKLLGTTNYGF